MIEIDVKFSGMGGLLETSKHAGVVYSVMLNRGWMDISVKNLSAIILTDLYGCSDKYGI